MKIYDIFEDEDSLADHVNNNLWHWQGGFSRVWDLSKLVNKPVVLKMTDDECYVRFLEFIKLNPTLKHLPTIHDHIVINDCNYVLMDKLYYSDKYNNEQAQMQGWWEADPCVWKGECESLDYTLDKLQEFYECNHKEHSLHWDLRDSNIMQDINDELVIIDPWSESQCY